MRYRTLEQTKEVATIRPTAGTPRLSKRERLERWAELLEQHGGALQSLYETEFAPWHRRRTMREDNSPLSVAYADPILRAQGLKGDAYGEAVDFFGLSHGEAHHILCYCHCGHTISSELVATRVRHAASHAQTGTAAALSLWLLPSAAAAAAAIAALLS
jgi:hypothetical protein